MPRNGYKFVVSDFSAIKARGIAYLAGEEWRSEVFKNGGEAVTYEGTGSNKKWERIESYGSKFVENHLVY